MSLQIYVQYDVGYVLSAEQTSTIRHIYLLREFQDKYLAGKINLQAGEVLIGPNLLKEHTHKSVVLCILNTIYNDLLDGRNHNSNITYKHLSQTVLYVKHLS